MTIIFFPDPNHAKVSYIQREAVSKSILHPSQSPWSGQTAFESQVAIHTGEREALPHPSLLTMAHFLQISLLSSLLQRHWAQVTRACVTSLHCNSGLQKQASSSSTWLCGVRQRSDTWQCSRCTGSKSNYRHGWISGSLCGPVI